MSDSKKVRVDPSRVLTAPAGTYTPLPGTTIEVLPEDGTPVRIRYRAIGSDATDAIAPLVGVDPPRPGPPSEPAEPPPVRTR